MRKIATGLALLHLLAATAGTAQSRTETAAENKSDCIRSVTGFFVHPSERATRVSMTFSGTQGSLLPLYDALSRQPLMVDLIPITHEFFILNIINGARKAPPADAKTLSEHICTLGLSKGAWFHGALEFAGNEVLSGNFPARPNK